jgi:hypothetical protein
MTFHRTVLSVEILSDGPADECDDLTVLAEQAMDGGDWTVSVVVVSDRVITSDEMANVAEEVGI